MVIMKFKSQLATVSDRASVYLQKAGIVRTRLQKSAGDELKEVRQQSEDVFRKLRAISRDALFLAIEGVTRTKSEISGASRKVIVQVQLAQEAAATVGRAGFGKVRRLRRQSGDDLRRLRAGCHDAIFATGEKIAGLASQASAASERAAMKFTRMQKAVAGFARTVVDKPRRMREARWAKEHELRSLLVSSLDPIVVTDSDRRLVAANARALELFGISELNMRNFTLDAFVPNFDWSNSSFASRGARVSRCKIRRLDGGLRLAECQFVADIVPHRCLCKFLSVTPYKITPPTFAKGNRSAALLGTVENQSNSARTALNQRR